MLKIFVRIFVLSVLKNAVDPRRLLHRRCRLHHCCIYASHLLSELVRLGRRKFYPRYSILLRESTIGTQLVVLLSAAVSYHHGRHTSQH